MGMTKNGRIIFGNLFQKQTGTKTFKNFNFRNTNNNNASGTMIVSRPITLALGAMDKLLTPNCDTPTQATTTSASSYVTSQWIFALGRNNTPETENDYRLENTNLTTKAFSIVEGSENGILTFSTTVYNRTEESETVKEIGIALTMGVCSETTGKDVDNILLFRKVLESPVTILPDETYTFTLIIK